MIWRRAIRPGTAILAAAERLYADRGFGDVTLRDIVAAANVNLAAVNYHFGSKDELIAELFVTRSLATNRERLNELKRRRKQAAAAPPIDAIFAALVGPTLRGCLGPDREGSTAARFMIRASIESVPPIRRIKNREVDHLRKFVAAMRRALPGRDDADLYWGLHFALAMAHHTIRERERLTKLSEGQCDLNDVAGDRRSRGLGLGDGADGRRGAGEEGACPAGGATWTADAAGSVSWHSTCSPRIGAAAISRDGGRSCPGIARIKQSSLCAGHGLLRCARHDMDIVSPSRGVIRPRFASRFALLES